MAILIDKPVWWFRGERWSHLVSDVSYDELHAFVDQLGVPRRAFQGDHYDIPERYWQACVDLGAEPTDSRVLVRRLRAAGLRKRPVGRRAIKPMKAVAGGLPVGDGWAYEIKWDGMRAIAAYDDSGVRAHSSRLNDITPRFPELESLKDALAVEAVLDGELVALGDDGLPSFSRLQGRMHLDRPHDIARKAAEIPVVYVVFDVLRIDGTDTFPLPYEQRRQLLEQLVEPGPTWQLATVHHEEPAALLDAVVERGMEGLVAKRLGSTYQPGARSADWVKVKPRRRQELVVGGLLSGEGDRTEAVAAVLVGYHDDQGLRFAGRVGSGLTDAESRELIARTRPTTDSPFVDDIPDVRGRTITFVEPEVVVEVAFGEWTPDNNLRHPVYLGRRPDVDPTDVPREPDPTP